MDLLNFFKDHMIYCNSEEAQTIIMFYFQKKVIKIMINIKKNIIFNNYLFVFNFDLYDFIAF